jgi:hypothetical protein
MAARPAPSQAATIPDHLSPETAARPFPIPDDGAIEVLGRAMKGVAAAEPSTNGHDVSTAGETMRALRLLALDNLIDLVQLRESLTERDAQVSLLEAEVSAWRQRALTEASARKADAAEAYDRQRELVTVLHRQLIQNDELQDELTRQRRSWWHRLFHRRITPGPATASAPH